MHTPPPPANISSRAFLPDGLEFSIMEWCLAGHPGARLMGELGIVGIEDCMKEDAFEEVLMRSMKYIPVGTIAERCKEALAASFEPGRTDPRCPSSALHAVCIMCRPIPTPSADNLDRMLVQHKVHYEVMKVLSQLVKGRSVPWDGVQCGFNILW